MTKRMEFESERFEFGISLVYQSIYLSIYNSIYIERRENVFMRESKAASFDFSVHNLS